MTPLSVVIITFNEEKNIGRCLESVKVVADDVVVTDSFSTDQTKTICEQFGVRFIQHAFEGHIEQKNFALTQALYPHVLSLDADECLSEELQQSILEVKNNWQFDGYMMNRLSNFCGNWIHHSGWYPDRKLRLFDRRKGSWGGTNPHDKFEMSQQASIGFLKGDILHYTAYTEDDYLKKMERYAEIAAAELFKKNKPAGKLTIYVKTMANFLRNYIIHMGFLDGYAGYRVSKISAWYTFRKYSKLSELRRKN